MKKLIFILPFLLFFSCEVQKRKYQKGFYVSNNKSKAQNKKDNGVVAAKKAIKADQLVLRSLALTVESVEPSPILEASVTKQLLLHTGSYKQLNVVGNDSLCDKITLKNGDDINAKVLEITPTEIKYKKCESSDGPLYVVRKTDVFMVKYANGTKEVFKTQEPAINTNQNQTTNNRPYNGPKKVQPMAVISLVLGILGFVPILLGIPSVFAILFANMALKKIRLNPNEYNGELLAKIGRVLGIIVLAILAIALVIVFALILGGI